MNPFFLDNAPYVLGFVSGIDKLAGCLKPILPLYETNSCARTILAPAFDAKKNTN
jgi:hypothetical protein